MVNWENGWTETSAWKQIFGSKLSPSTQSVPIRGLRCVEDVKAFWNSRISKTDWTTACISTCLQVLCEETATALELYGKQHCIDVIGTVTFIRKVLKWWTIMNVKNKGIDLRKGQPLQAVNFTPKCPQISIYRRIRGNVSQYEWLKMCLKSNSLKTLPLLCSEPAVA